MSLLNLRIFTAEEITKKCFIVFCLLFKCSVLRTKSFFQCKWAVFTENEWLEWHWFCNLTRSCSLEEEFSPFDSNVTFVFLFFAMFSFVCFILLKKVQIQKPFFWVSEVATPRTFPVNLLLFQLETRAAVFHPDRSSLDQRACAVRHTDKTPSGVSGKS